MKEPNGMIQATPEAASWITEHFWSIVQFLILFAAIVGAWFTLRGKVEQVEIEQADQCERLERVESHVTDTARHRDPERDERRLLGIEHSLDQILAELRRLGRGEKV
jgi:hypothetical protein